MAHGETEPIARVVWQNHKTGTVMEYLLMEGATATIGRSRSNDICVPERHVSRRHAVIQFQDGGFLISDLGSANGTFVNDQPISEPYLLLGGDKIRLFVPELRFAAYAGPDAGPEPPAARTTSMIISPTNPGQNPYLVVTSGAQEGAQFRLLKSALVVGRATANAAWDICLQDRAVSRPHCRVEQLSAQEWGIIDLGSANGTRVNGGVIPAEIPRILHDGDVLTIGATLLLFRVG